MRIEIRKSAIKDLQKINEPFKSKLHEKIITLKNFPDVSNKKQDNKKIDDRDETHIR